jgi:hypothetical protein
MSVRERWLVAALVLLPLLPFSGAAFGIDAPVFLAVARRILEAPLDPFGFEMVWDATSLEVARFNLNPPLFSYWLAPGLGAFGEREAWLRATTWPFPLLAAFAFHGIARRAGVEALPATALFVATPAFLVLATTLQLDVPVEALLLAAVYALLRARESGSWRWELCAGAAAAAAGLTKYVGLAALPLLGAGLVLLPGAAPRRSAVASWLRVVGVPVLAFALWGAWSHARYGFVHYAAGLALVGERNLTPAELVNHLASLPIWIGGALFFPVCFFALRLLRAGWGVELALGCGLAGAGVAAFVLPGGEPLRRVPLDLEDAVLAAICFAAALCCYGLVLARGPALLRDPLDRFLALWAGGFLSFSLFVNWHVNAADALLAGPPLLLLLLRDSRLRPSARVQWSWAASSLLLSLLLAAADTAQCNVYRRAATQLREVIGDAPGGRWLVGQWGFQYYLTREGFAPVMPTTRTAPASALQPGDFLATARNVSQLDLAATLARFQIVQVRSFVTRSALPLRTTNPDAGAGFYSHHGGYVPFSFSRAPLDEIELGRVLR